VSDAWDLLVRKDDFTDTRIVERAPLAPGPNEILLRVDRVGMTANNVTYALAGDMLRYWSFFPAEDGWGRVPLWGFADVTGSNHPEVEVGTRVFGYLPPSSDLVVKPDRISDGGFQDVSSHRSDLPRTYNVYAATTADPAYVKEREDLQILYRPLFFTSFMLDDFLADNDFFGAEAVLFSSASSKTAYGTAFCIGLREQRPVRVGLTSSGNVEFTESLGCYDKVLSYDDVNSLSADRSMVYVDVAGSKPLRAAIHKRLGDKLVYDAIVGTTHLDTQALAGGEDLPGPTPTFFFAPDQIKKRREDWGRGGVEKGHAIAWREFAPVVQGWVDITVGESAEGLRAAWLEVLSGKTDPRVGHVISL
jgi:Protein of unknown function (DUF2855)